MRGLTNRRGEYKEFIEQFAVGLIEGDGSIPTVHIRDTNKRVGIVVALKNLESNERMLRILEREIGGRVVIERDEKYVTWYLTKKEDI